MAQVKITDLPNALPLTGFESVPIVQNGVTVQTTTGAISVQPNQTQTFLTATQQTSLPNSRYLATGDGLDTVDGGAQGTLQINLTGAASSLNSVGNGLMVKTDLNTLTPRAIDVGTGLGITNANGVDGDPLIALGDFLANFQSMSGSTGLIGVSGGLISPKAIAGTPNNIDVTNGDGSTGNPTINLVSTAVTPGTYQSATFTVDEFGRITEASSGTAGGVTFFSAGTTGFTPSTPTSGSITLDGVLSVLHGGSGVSTLTGYLVGNGISPFTGVSQIPTTDLSGTISNAQLANSSVTINGSSVSLGGSITVTATASNALTIGTGLTGSSYNGSTPVTIAIDSTVATLSDVQTLTNKTISGSNNTLSNIGNGSLTNSSVTFNGSTVALGGSATITASTTNALTIGTGLIGTSFNGGSAVTIAIDSTVATLSGTQTLTNKSISGSTNTLTNIGNTSLTNSSVTLGTTTVALGATSLTLAGLTSVTVTQDPTQALQLASKQYVDSVAQGLNVKTSVLWGTTANITLSGLTTQAGGEWTATLTAGDRILVKNQSTAANNGIYAAASGTWTRTTDADTWNELISAFVFVQDGATLADTGWTCTINQGGTLGVTAVTWTQFSGQGTYTAGTGLTLTGTQFSLTAPVAASLGGSGYTSYTAGDLLYASGATALSKLAIGTSTYIMTSSGTAPQWSNPTGITVGAATNATNTNITANSINATNYLTFVSATTGNLPQLVNSAITCNPSTGQITGGIAGGAF